MQPSAAPPRPPCGGAAEDTPTPSESLMPYDLLDMASHGLLHAAPTTVLLYLLVTTQLTIFSVTLYLHRSQTHRSVDFHPALAHFFRFWSWLTTAVVTREWVAVHRKHHAHADTAQDPHSPYIVGIRRLLWEGSELYTAARHDGKLLAKYGRGTPDDWIERHVYTPHCNWGPTLLAFISVALFGVGGMAIWAVQMMWIPFWAAGVVNGIGHWWGSDLQLGSDAAGVHQRGSVRRRRHGDMGSPDDVDSLLGRRRGQWHRPLVGLSQFRDCGQVHQRRAAGHLGRWRGAAQQPSRLSRFGEVLGTPLRIRSGMVRHPGPFQTRARGGQAHRRRRTGKHDEPPGHSQGTTGDIGATGESHDGILPQGHLAGCARGSSTQGSPHAATFDTTAPR